MAEIRLTTGGIGTGKSYKNVKDAYEELQKGDKCKYKQIYSNIRAHAELCEGVSLLPDDWRECEKHSLIIIDECQSHEKFSKHFSNRRDSEIVDLTMIRHNHCDMWLISPNPTLVNKDVRDLVNVHVCLEANGAKTAKAYCFDKVQLNLSKSVKQRAFDEFTYTIEDKYCAMYKSTEDGEPSRRTYNVNVKLISFIAGLILVILIAIGLVTWLTSSAKGKVDEMVESETKNQPVDNKNINIDPMAQALNANQNKVSDQDCRKGANVERPECVEYFNNLTKNNSSVSDNSVKYDPSKPFDNEEIQQNISYQVTSKPVFSGCMKTNKGYVAYTQQGTRLNVSAQDCRNLIENNDRPFNYFAKESDTQKLVDNKTMENKSSEVKSNNEQYLATLYEIQRLEAERNKPNNQVVGENITQDKFVINGAHAL